MTENKVKELKDRLLTELINQFDNGVVAKDRDGDVVTLSVDAKVMTVAAKVIKDFAHEATETDAQDKQLQSLQGYLEKRKGFKVVAG